MIAPWLSVQDAAGAVAFYKNAFGAAEIERLEGENGDIAVAQLSINDALFWVQQDRESSPASMGLSSPVRMILIVEDPDATFSRAIAAGATKVVEVNDAHGWRAGRLVDCEGYHWEVAKRL